MVREALVRPKAMMVEVVKCMVDVFEDCVEG